MTNHNGDVGKMIEFKNGDIVVCPEFFGNKTLVFIGMAKGLDYSNDCAVICDGQPVPVRLSGLIKVEDK